jgi:hypothetical protein
MPIEDKTIENSKITRKTNTALFYRHQYVCIPDLWWQNWRKIRQESGFIVGYYRAKNRAATHNTTALFESMKTKTLLYDLVRE